FFAAIASGVGKARGSACRPTSAPGANQSIPGPPVVVRRRLEGAETPSAGAPSFSTRFRTIASVSAQVQFVVHRSLTRSSQTAGDRRSLPAPQPALHE